MTVVSWLWIIFAAAFALAGLILLARALFADRSRARKRCPKCWYDMTGATSLVCTECGRETRNERRLYRTRRHWWAALLGVLLALVGLGLYASGEVHRDGWVRATPTIVYVAALPWLNQTIVQREINDRVKKDELQEWECRLLIHRCIGTMRSCEDPQVLRYVINLVALIDACGRVREADSPWKSSVRVSAVAGTEAVEVLSALFDHTDYQVRLNALECIRAFRDDGVLAYPSLLGQMTDSDGRVAFDAAWTITMLCDPFHQPAVLSVPQQLLLDPANARTVRALDESERDYFRLMGLAGADLAQSVVIMKQGTCSASPLVRALSIYGLARLAPNDREVRKLILERVSDDDERVRSMVIGATSVYPFDDEIAAILEGAVTSGDPSYRRDDVLRAISARGHDASRFLPIVQHWLERAIPQNGMIEEVHCYERLGGEPGPVEEVLTRWLTKAAGERFVQRGGIKILDAFAEWSHDCPEACSVIEPYLMNDDPDIGSAAALAYVKCNGENLDLATMAIFRAVFAVSGKYGTPAMDRWKRFAQHGRISIPVLMYLLQSERMENRQSATEFLSNTFQAGIPALPKLTELRGDPDTHLQSWADYAIKRIEWARDHPEWRPAQ